MNGSARDAGWYPDPWGTEGQQRYFDGDAWRRNDTPTTAPRKARPRGRSRWRAVGVVAAVLAVLAAASGGWFATRSRSPLVGSLRLPSDHGRSSTTRQPGPALRDRPYARGDCVTWRQVRTGVVDAKVVGCTEPHLLEIVGPVTLTGLPDKYPTLGGWMLIEAAQCGPRVEKYLRAVLDTYGRYAAGAIRISTEGWDQGERLIWCGIQAVGGAVGPGAKLPELLGRADAHAQGMISTAGTCVGTPSANDGTPIACADPHIFEVTGTVDLSARQLGSPTSEATRQAAQQPCEVVTTAYLGHAVGGDLEADVLGIEPVSWAAGRRVVECVVARSSGSDWVPVSGSMKASS